MFRTGRHYILRQVPGYFRLYHTFLFYLSWPLFRLFCQCRTVHIPPLPQACVYMHLSMNSHVRMFLHMLLPSLLHRNILPLLAPVQWGTHRLLLYGHGRHLNNCIRHCPVDILELGNPQFHQSICTKYHSPSSHTPWVQR